MRIIQSRRTFLAGAGAAGAVSAIGITPEAWAEASPETTSVRLPRFDNSDCQTPEYISEELLRAEGITNVQFVTKGTGPDSSDWIAHGEVDFDWNFPPTLIGQINNGIPIKILAGMHSGCLELIANDSIATIANLKGKRIGIDGLATNTHKLVIITTAYLGFDPDKDIEWVTVADSVEAFAEGKIDAFLGTPPQPEIIRERKLGHVILLSTSNDRPWSQYYCCMLSGSEDYVSRYPVATKHVMRALFKAIDLCVTEPEWAASAVVAKKFAGSYQFALQAMKEVRYDRWREYDPEDSVRFYALRMKEVGFIKINPNEIIARGTDWRFLNEIKRELKT